MESLTPASWPTDVSDASAWAAYGRAWGAAYALGAAPAPHRPRPTRSPSRPNFLPYNQAHRLTLQMHAYREGRPGPRWQGLARATWAAYDRWFRARPLDRQPDTRECRAALRRHLPRLLPTWELLTDLAVDATGATPDDAGRLLSLWRPPPFIAGCSQLALTTREPMLARSYDYDLALFEGVVASTNYSGTRRVLGTSDCLWGLLDGMNDDGLAISLTYGGRPGSGDGFGIPLVIRAVLEECGDVAEAVARLRTLPVAQAYNLTLLDAAGSTSTVFVAPGQEPIVTPHRLATNHRLDVIEHPAIAARLRSRERYAALTALADAGAGPDAVMAAFLTPPIRSAQFDAGFGSLYCALFRPRAGSVDYHWPGRTWTRRYDDPDETISVEVFSDESPRGCRSRPGGGTGGRRPARSHG